MKQEIKQVLRFSPQIEQGLNEKEVRQRQEEGQVNYDTNLKTKTVKEIVETNLFTLFNFLNLALGASILLVGSYKNLLFLGVVFCNIIISTAQEIRSKKIVDQLSIVAASKSKVIRDGKLQEIEQTELVLDDIIKLASGNQVVTDCILKKGSCEVNESMITGESELVFKKEGDLILSGSFLVTGSCTAQVEHVGLENYTSTISRGAKYVKKVNSELMFSLNKVIKIISIIIIPVGLLLFRGQLSLDGNTFTQAVVNTVAALIGMIPEGLILLTSMVLAVSVIRLSKFQVLVQQLYCIETLARVDVICLDKTGTITEGTMVVHDVIPFEQTSKLEVEQALTGLCHALDDSNATMDAIRVGYMVESDWICEETIAFSSSRKWSGASFKGHGTYLLGAPEFLLKERYSSVAALLEPYTKENRVLLLVHTKDKIIKETLPKDLKIMSILLLRDKIRPEAKKTLEYFKNQGVIIKIISGDNVQTVSEIAHRVGVEQYQNYIDASTLTSKEELEKAANIYTIFGRVTPDQKRDLVLAIKKAGHTVAMTGDGINDVLALKESDCSIAMASGSDAARTVSELVLLNSNFDSLPSVVAEGRRTINNIERSASLFLVKTIYATLLAVLFLFLNKSYPFIPIQLTLTSIVTIGIPSFILALEPNRERIKGNFLINVFSKSIPSALTIVFNILIVQIITSIYQMSMIETSTLCVMVTAYVGFLLLFQLCTPFDGIRRLLFFSMVTIFVIAFIFLRPLFSLADLTGSMVLFSIALMVIDVYLFTGLTNIIYRFLSKREKRFVRR